MTESVVKVSVSDDSDSSDDQSSHESEEETMDVGGTEADSEGDIDDDTENPLIVSNEGWADSIARILGSNKPKNKKTLVLSRAKKHSETIKSQPDKPEFEVIGDVKEEVKTELAKVDRIIKKKTDKPSIRCKPNIIEKDRERVLSKIATKGVVQLFNAVRNQQKSLGRQLDRKDLTETKKEKIMKKFDKRSFLDTLMGQTKSVVVDNVTNTFKNDVKDEEDTKWSALRDDFMMGAKMKDWDKASMEE